MGKKTPTAKKRAADQARRRKLVRLGAICAAMLCVAAATVAIVYFATNKDSPPRVTELETSDLVVGTGAEAKEGDRLSVYYSTWVYSDWLEDGDPIDSGPYTFTLGAGKVIEGWDQGVPGMRVGGKRVLLIPPELAYGDTKFGDLAPNSSLACEVELVAIL